MDLSPLTLEGRRVRLEPLAARHLDGIWEVARDPTLWLFTVTRIGSRAEVDGWFAQAMADQERKSALVFATVESATGRVVGSTRFMNASVPDRRVEIGSTFVGRAWQRTPINTEAKYLMLRHAFEAWRCVRVELKTGLANLVSRQAILRLGAVQEGVLRRHTRMHDGTWRDTVYFSVLDGEWPKVRAELEAKLAR
jgi:RimJ/RimL family protein N-acetyltransferase